MRKLRIYWWVVSDACCWTVPCQNYLFIFAVIFGLVFFFFFFVVFFSLLHMCVLCIRAKQANTPRHKCMAKTLHAYRIYYHNSVVSIIFVHSFCIFFLFISFSSFFGCNLSLCILHTTSCSRALHALHVYAHFSCRPNRIVLTYYFFLFFSRAFSLSLSISFARCMHSIYNVIIIYTVFFTFSWFVVRLIFLCILWPGLCVVALVHAYFYTSEWMKFRFLV